nr:DUF1049 domain-containing protein [Rhizobiaceae bacterium]
MLNRLVTVLIVIPVAIVLIAFSVANRAPAVVSLDPFNPANPALSWAAPMFLWLSAALVTGVLVGGVASWFAQGHHRKAER